MKIITQFEMNGEDFIIEASNALGEWSLIVQGKDIWYADGGFGITMIASYRTHNRALKERKRFYDLAFPRGIHSPTIDSYDFNILHTTRRPRRVKGNSK